jgi:hypothetical protein
MAGKAKWTFMVYMAGDNNLSAAGDKDLGEMRQVGSTPEVNIIVQFDNAGERGTHRIRALSGGQNDVVMSLGETDSGDPKTLEAFIEWTAKTYPAERYALVLWSHGSAWEPSEIEKIARSVNSPNFNQMEATKRSVSPTGKVMFRSSLERIYQLPTSGARAICVDDGSGHSLDTLELEKVLAKAKKVLGQEIDLLGMDACLMSNLEVAYQVRPYVKYLVASEESEPNDGWPYERVLQHLVNNPDLPTAQAAEHVVRDYIQSYLDRGYKKAITQTALDLERMDDLIAPLDGLAVALTAMDRPQMRKSLWDALYTTTSFWGGTLMDIPHMCKELEKQPVSEAVRQACAQVRAALAQGSGRFVIAEGHNGKTIANCGGVSIYLPMLKDMSRFYPELAFASKHPWLKVVQKYQIGWQDNGN